MGCKLRYSRCYSEKIKKVCNVYLEERKEPETGLIVSIPKKVNLAECSNWQGKTLK